MGILDKLLHRTPAAAATPPAVSTTCPHLALTARWDNLDDIGHDDRATGYRCDACAQEFTPAEVQSLRLSEADRLRGLQNPPSSN